MNEYITEEMWVKMHCFLQDHKLIYSVNEESLKLFIQGVFWILRTGAQWRRLPKEYGKWNSVFKRFNAWSKKGIWEDFFLFCSQDPDLEYVMIDSTIIRAHASAAGYGKQEKEGLGRSKGGFSTKVHSMSDALGYPLKFIVTPGNTSDITQAENLLKDISNAYVIADKGYISADLHSKLIAQSCIPVIPSRSNSKNPAKYDKRLYKERYRIELLFSKMKYFRRVFSRFEKSARNLLAFLHFFGALLWLR